MSGAQPCQYCGRPVVVRQLRTGRPRPFERALLPPAEIHEDARYVPVQSGRRVVMVPARDMAPGRLERVRWFAVLHTCRAGLEAWRVERDPEGLDAVGQQLAALWGAGSPAGGAGR